MTQYLTENLKIHAGLFKGYELLPASYDEFFGDEAKADPYIEKIVRYFDQYTPEQFTSLHRKALELFKQRGITFNVYSDKTGQEKIFPFDLLPRAIPHKEWEPIKRGLEQRVQALNAFLKDVYGAQQILKDGVISRELILSSKGYLPQLQGINPIGGVHVHISGIDLIRDEERFVILEDNLKVPSGVSYVLENRRLMKEFFPAIFRDIAVEDTDIYPIQLKKSLFSLLPSYFEDPLMVLLTPGPYNSAYYEHLYLSQRMGCPLVRNSELTIEDHKVYLKTLQGLKRVHIIYRRTDDEYLDPTIFKAESCLGIPGLIDAYRRGNVLLANAPGNGVADDKAIYSYVPAIIRYYLGEEAILPQVQTYSCADVKTRKRVLDNPRAYVIKVVNQSGGYGVLIGEQASKQQLEEVRLSIMANPRDYIVQPLKQLSTSPTMHGGKISPRRIDFRPFIVYGKEPWVLPGGLTRVALESDSYIVNSSQGGGSKDTWVLGTS